MQIINMSSIILWCPEILSTGLKPILSFIKWWYVRCIMRGSPSSQDKFITFTGAKMEIEGNFKWKKKKKNQGCLLFGFECGPIYH